MVKDPFSAIKIKGRRGSEDEFFVKRLQKKIFIMNISSPFQILFILISFIMTKIFIVKPQFQEGLV